MVKKFILVVFSLHLIDRLVYPLDVAFNVSFVIIYPIKGCRFFSVELAIRTIISLILIKITFRFTYRENVTDIPRIDCP